MNKEASSGQTTLSSWYTHSLRVRYQETDQMAIVYHANYLNWFEMGRTEFIRQFGFTYRSMEENGVLLPVIDLNIQFKRPALYDDLVAVFTRVIRFSPLRLDFEYEVRRWQGDLEGGSGLSNLDKKWPIDRERPGELLVAGTSSHAWVNKEIKPIRLDKTLPELYNILKGQIL
ncbi:acyl-CoA thioesterase [Paenibacillus physcomitrellae]|uniref:4-hydroxybenzoyl-CoA thioesterase n=1 Tax=Paenibacillus physcomitrellae TaxID=1619311 RepID=A0ABQ1GYP3_9BACL|nr:thioesterase family protein [Paenibacillus physcomitrellae]GGA52798.1 4-hydroxybenzoyl-CoA thioesterase [Paenibacillus physcomitrellae]